MYMYMYMYMYGGTPQELGAPAAGTPGAGSRQESAGAEGYPVIIWYTKPPASKDPYCYSRLEKKELDHVLHIRFHEVFVLIMAVRSTY